MLDSLISVTDAPADVCMTHPWPAHPFTTGLYFRELFLFVTLLRPPARKAQVVTPHPSVSAPPPAPAPSSLGPL
jgi:hypothetical protein